MRESSTYQSEHDGTAPLCPGQFQQLVEGLPAITYVQHVAETVATHYVSPQVEPLLGWTPAEYGASRDDWFRAVHPDDRVRLRDAVARAVASGNPLDVAYRVGTRDGRVTWLRDRAAVSGHTVDGAQIWHGIQVDISAEKAAEQELHQLAYFDSLTGLPNRRLCMDRLQALLAEPDREGVSLLFLDLDRFKFINDGIGHVAGDELLAAVAGRLSALVDGPGSLARFGGDEFVAVMEDASLQEIEELAETLLTALRRPFNLNGYSLHVEATIGIAVSSPDLQTPESLLHAADMALYRAKADGRGVFRVYDPELDQSGPDRLMHEAELRRALDEGQFQIAYQPVVDIETRRILAVEALVRWWHPERGLLEPAAFIPFADETGLIVPLGAWVIEEACRQMQQWQTHVPAMRPLQVSVNLSGRQFRHATLVDDVARILQRTALPPHRLALEIKEGDALADAAAVAQAVRAFKRLGVKVTIDDFGKGLAALGSLTQFTIDDLKIDGSCVSRLGQRQQDIDVVRTLVTMAKTMGLDVTAGAVETGEQLAMLRDMGCDRAQGHHLAPPLSAAELEQHFRSMP